MLRLALASAILVVVVSTARAQEPTADQLIEHGVALREDGRDDEALAIFHRAYDTTPSGQAMAQIALAEQALGRLVDAEAHLARALEAEPDRFVRRNRALLEQALAEIRAQLTDLTLNGGVDGAEVRIDGVVRGTLPLSGPLRVQAGTAHLEVRAEGHRALTRELIVTVDTPLSLDVALEPLPTSAAPAITEPVVTPVPVTEPAHEGGSSSAWMMPTGIALGAAGVVGIAVASGLMAWREDNAQARLTCMDTDPACRARYGTAVDAETAGIATFVVSGLLLAGGATLLIIDLTSPRSATSSHEMACAPGLLALSCAGTF